MIAGTNLMTGLNKIRKQEYKTSGLVQLSEKSLQLTELNQFQVDLLNPEAIYHINDIKKLCIDYRLRFLDLIKFKGSFPEEATDKLKALEKLHQTTVTHLKIVAPAKLFKLDNFDDPLLFASLGNDYFYLIHKWGKDLKPLRKCRMWPFKNLENLIVTLLILSIALTLLVPDGLFSKNTTINESFIVFLFMFKWVVGLVIYFGIAAGKYFNDDVWDSNYINA